jgi:hypothetical protein
LTGGLDFRALERALDALIKRHESLRTHFSEEDGEPFQVIDPTARVPILVQNLSELDAAEREDAVGSMLRSFDGDCPCSISAYPWRTVLAMIILRGCGGICTSLQIWRWTGTSFFGSQIRKHSYA